MSEHNHEHEGSTPDPDETGEFPSPTQPARPTSKSSGSPEPPKGRGPMSFGEEEAETFIGGPGGAAKPLPKAPGSSGGSTSRPGEPGAWGGSIVSGSATDPGAFPAPTQATPPTRASRPATETAGGSVEDSWDRPAPAGGAAPTVVGHSASVPVDPDPEIVKNGFIGPYRVIEQVGRGGMGVVYRARDERLARDVAIKVLPDVFAEHQERVARFDREARLLASFTHKNIAQIFELGDQGGLRYIVMEYVPGDTLSKRLQNGPLPMEEALAISIQIAEGLEEAHERGVIHRDLKPGNVKITPDGTVKVLDFGLAKAQGAEPDHLDAGNTPTGSLENTQAGVILGTAGYMSPEQARGQVLDRRTDVWSFGCVLYESLTAHTPFEGATFTDTISRILQGEPEWGKLPEGTPRRVLDVIQRCLRKQARKRLRDLGDARLDLEDALERLHAGDLDEDERVLIRQAPSPDAPKTPWMSWIVALAALCVAVILLLMLITQPPRSSSRVMHLSESLPDGAVVDLSGPMALAVSPGGDAIAYVAKGEAGRTSLFVRELESDEPAHEVPESWNATEPFFSPDGASVGFVRDGGIFQAAVRSRAAPMSVGPRSMGARSAAWVGATTIVFSDGTSLHAIDVRESRNPRPIATPTGGERFTRPVAIPGDGSHVLFTIGGRTDRAGIHSVGLGGGDPRWVAAGERGSIVSLPSQKSAALVFDASGVLRAVRVDPGSLKTQGATVNLDTVRAVRGAQGAQFAAAGAGMMVFAPGQEQRLMMGSLQDAGEPVLIAEDAARLRSPRIEPAPASRRDGQAWSPRVACLSGDPLQTAVRLYSSAGFIEEKVPESDWTNVAATWRAGRNEPTLTLLQRSDTPSGVRTRLIVNALRGAVPTAEWDLAVADARWDTNGERLFIAVEGADVQLFSWKDGDARPNRELVEPNLAPFAPSVAYGASELMAYVIRSQERSRVRLADGLGTFDGDTPVWTITSETRLWRRDSRRLVHRVVDPSGGAASVDQVSARFTLALQPGAFDIDPDADWVAYLASGADDGALRVIVGLDKLLTEKLGEP